MFIGSCAGSLYSLDRTTGNPIWLYDTSVDGSPAQFHGEPLLIGDRVVIPTDSVPSGHLYSFDIASGELLWKLPFNFGITATPLLIGDHVVIVSSEGDVATIDAKSGKIQWRVTPFGTLKANPFLPSPAHAAGRIFVGDNTNQVLALDPKDGATRWRTSLSGRSNTALVVIDDHVVVGTEDGFLNWIAMKSGEVKKRVKLGGMPHGTPVPAGPLLLVLVSAGHSKLVALDSKTGAIRWEQETPKEWTTYRPLVTGSVVIVGNDDKDLCAFDRTTGERRWCRPVGEVPRGLGISEDGILYVGSLPGVVQAFRMSTNETR